MLDRNSKTYKARKTVLLVIGIVYYVLAVAVAVLGDIGAGISFMTVSAFCVWAGS
jgi:hypothetical protein